MGGDHKCPVCQATFTRPQHVARHMRSHTGDRPYKCQYCGDQFARSDLLSRHINKCHADEKPLPTTTGGRRKGTASTQRATTSKQACDQCVQSSLPCDGCNPCSKCVSRKCRCTWVKFARQTLPSGPGHHTRGTPAFSASMPHLPLTHAMPGAVTDDFLLGIGPSVAGQQQLSSRAAQQQLWDPAGFVPPPNAATDDFAAKYRAQADLLRRAQVHHAQGGDGSGAGVNLPPLFPSQPQQAPSLAPATWGLPPPSLPHQAGAPGPRPWESPHSAFSSPEAPSTLPIAGGGLRQDNPGSLGYSQLSLPPYASGADFNDSQSSRSTSLGVNFDYDFGANNSDGEHSYGSANTSSSSAHQFDMNDHQPHPHAHHQHSHSHTGLTPQQVLDLYGRNSGGNNPGSSNGHTSSGHHSRNTSSSSTGTGGGGDGFHSAFGLMSLEDPNVLAGLSNDGVPFFSSSTTGAGSSQTGSVNGDEDATPMQGVGTGSGNNAGAGGKSRGMAFPMTPGTARETEMRELREFWKAYMRTPLSGPGSVGLLSGAEGPLAAPMSTNGNGSSNNGSNGLNSSEIGRRPRVASLPSAGKTPTVDNLNLFNLINNNNNNITNSRMALPALGQQQQDTTGTGNHHPRTAHTGDDDLKSYEAAILARTKPEISLAPPPRRRQSAAAHQQQQHSTALAAIKQENNAMNGNSSSSDHFSNAMSLSPPMGSNNNNMVGSDAFGGGSGGQNQGAMLPPQAQGHSEAATTAFQRAGSVSDAGTDASDAESSSGRPSFKRLPSRTLEPEHAKRAALMRRMSYEAEDALSSSGSPVLTHSRPSSSHSHSAARYAGDGSAVALPSSASTVKTEFDDAFYRSPSNSSSNQGQGGYSNGKMHSMWGVPPGPMQPPTSYGSNSSSSNLDAVRQRRLSAPESPPHHMQRFAMNTSMPPVS